ncbi:hypothetical protein ANN_10018 [Periplaneta americana]|uniref:HTH psq-type domain-containing protein n=1 Tax=Periplaneta americana TaxID=6978 RepID=A0ABQ8TQ75_PERAM|nr:hypothetical protein ANN_10018 [Periplaneta americana]
MAGLWEGGNEPADFLKAICQSRDTGANEQDSCCEVRLAVGSGPSWLDFFEVFFNYQVNISIKKWHDTFLATGSVLKHGGGRRTSDEIVANVQAAYERSPRKSLRRASRELQVPKSTLQRIVHKRLKLYAYKMQLMQRLEPDDKPKRVEFALLHTGSMTFVRLYTTCSLAVVLRHSDLRERIIEAIGSIPEDMLQHAWQEIVHRLDIVTVTAEAQVEI